MWNFNGNWAILALNVYGNFIGRPTGLAFASLILMGGQRGSTEKTCAELGKVERTLKKTDNLGNRKNHGENGGRFESQIT